MNIRQVFYVVVRSANQRFVRGANNDYRVMAVACLWLCLPLVAQKAAFAQEFAPQKRSLAIPIVAKAGSTVECVVPFGPAMPISAVAFSPDGNTLAVGGYEEVLLWDLAAAKLSKRLGVGKLGGAVRALAFAKDGKLLAVGEGKPKVSGAVRIFNVESGDVAHSFEEPADVVLSLAFSPDGKLLAGSGAYTPVHVWNIEERKLVTTIEGHADWVLGVAFSADGKFLATASADRALKVWGVSDWKSTTTFVQEEAVRGGDFGTDVRILVAAVLGPGRSGVVMRRTDNIRYTRSLYMTGGSPLDVFWERKKNRIYIPCTDNTVKVFDGNGSRLVATLTGHEDWVYGVAANADGTKVASASADGTVKLWNTADGKLMATLVQLSPRTEQWVIVTAQGYVAASSAGDLQWKTANVKTPPEEITAIMQNTELVQKALAGEKTDPPAIQ